MNKMKGDFVMVQLKTICFSNSGCSAEEEDFLRLMRIVGAERTRNIFDADCIVQHFCGMSTESYEAIPRIMYFLQRIKEENPETKIFVGGCATEVLDLKTRYAFVDGVFARRRMVEDISKYLGYDPESDKAPISNHYAIRIQSGCMRQCGFCKKHFMNMPLESKPIDQIKADIEEVLKKGFNQVQFLAENSTEYGLDIACKLIDLLEVVEKDSRIKRVFLTGLCLDELALMQELVKYIESSNKIVGVQVKIQSLIPVVRKNMRLTSTREEVLEILQHFSNKFITTNIMVGYPGETDSDFDEQLNLIKEHKMYYVQANKFDATPGTPGYEMQQISRILVEKRLIKLFNLLKNLKKEQANKMIKTSENGYTGVAVGKHCILLDGINASVIVEELLTSGKEYTVKVTGFEELFEGKEQDLILKGVLMK